MMKNRKWKSIIIVLVLNMIMFTLTGCNSTTKADGTQTTTQDTASNTDTNGAAASENSATPAASEESTDTAASEPFKINVAVDSGTFAYPFWVAENKGIFDKYNIEAEFQVYAYGIDTINAVQLDQADVGEAMDFAAVSRLGGESELQFISFIAGTKIGGSNLYVFDENIKEVKELEGKSVVVQKGTVNEYTWAKLYSQHGVDSSKVNPLYISSTAEGLALVKSGEADAIWAGADIADQIKELGGISLGDYGLVGGSAPKGFLMLKKSYLEQNEDGIERLIQALKEAVDAINADPNEAAKIVKDNFSIPVENIAKALSDSEFDIRFTQEDADQLDGVTKWSIENGLLRYDFSVKDYIYLKPLQAVFPDRITYQQ